MRWNPIHTVETIVISVVSMLSDPTDESPANIDAAVRMSAEQLSDSKHFDLLTFGAERIQGRFCYF